MYHSFKHTLTTWAKETDDRQKLQHTYIALAGILLMAAGVIGLLNYALGQQLLAVAIAAAGVFLVNAVAWALLQSFVLMHLPTRTRDTKAKVTKK